MLAAVAHRDGHEVRIFAPDVECASYGKQEGVITSYSGIDKKMKAVNRKLDEILTSLSPYLVGISIWTARAITSIELARHIKSVSSRIIIVGGEVHGLTTPLIN